MANEHLKPRVDLRGNNEASEPPAVFAAISAVSAAIAKKGIAKDSRNVQQGFVFRGIDAVLNALNSALTANNLVILPSVKRREVTERATKTGGVLFTAVVHVDFDLVSTVDGSHYSVTFIGEAMDSGDKATNKALSAAYKYMAIQVFCIPTEGESPDADAVTHEPIAAPVTITSLEKYSTQAALNDYYKVLGSPKDAETLALFTAQKERINQKSGA